MNLINSLHDFLGGKKESGTPEGLCPNCWGRQEYNGVIREAIVDQQIDVNNHQQLNAFIRDFAVRHVDGIRLRSEKVGRPCPACESVFGD